MREFGLGIHFTSTLPVACSKFVGCCSKTIRISPRVRQLSVADSLRWGIHSTFSCIRVVEGSPERGWSLMAVPLFLECEIPFVILAFAETMFFISSTRQNIRFHLVFSQSKENYTAACCSWESDFLGSTETVHNDAKPITTWPVAAQFRPLWAPVIYFNIIDHFIL